MSILLLRPLKLGIQFNYINENKKIINKKIMIKKNARKEKSDYTQLVQEIHKRIINKNSQVTPLTIAIHSIYGGNEFTKETLVDKNTISKLKKIITNSPIHTNLLIDLIKNCQKIFNSAPIKIFFETSFFTELPEQEKYYAINSNLSKQYKLIRFGYHGIHHKESINFIKNKYMLKDNSEYKILSICLDKNSEIAGIKNGMPAFVSSGSTQLEGLPGEKRCGRIDSSIILEMIDKLKWGPEKINQLLIEDSGIYGLTDKKLALNELFSTINNKYKLAKNLFRYHLTLEAGAAIAAMGGVDYIVFSGTYFKLGKKIKTYLNKNAIFQNHDLKYDFLAYSNDKIIMNKILNQL